MPQSCSFLIWENHIALAVSLLVPLHHDGEEHHEGLVHGVHWQHWGICHLLSHNQHSSSLFVITWISSKNEWHESRDIKAEAHLLEESWSQHQELSWHLLAEDPSHQTTLAAETSQCRTNHTYLWMSPGCSHILCRTPWWWDPGKDA